MSVDKHVFKINRSCYKELECVYNGHNNKTERASLSPTSYSINSLLCK